MDTKKVLVAHPLRDTTQLLEIYLQKMGFGECIFATTDGEKARDFIRGNSSQLSAVVVSDRLPKLAGLDIAKLAKSLASERGLNIPVVIITCLPQELGRNHWKELMEMSDSQLLEPFSFQQFEETFFRATVLAP